MRCWYLPYIDESIEEIGRMKTALSLDIQGYERLKEEKRIRYFCRTLSFEKVEAIRQFQKFLGAQRYSQKTVITYSEAIRTFLSFFGRKPIEEISNDDMVEFNYRYIMKNRFSIRLLLTLSSLCVRAGFFLTIR